MTGKLIVLIWKILKMNNLKQVLEKKQKVVIIFWILAILFLLLLMKSRGILTF